MKIQTMTNDRALSQRIKMSKLSMAGYAKRSIECRRGYAGDLPLLGGEGRGEGGLKTNISPNLKLRTALNYVRNSRRAFTLIEIMVVVVILGILAATIIPQFMGTTHDAKVSAAKAHVAELESAVERFYVHMDRYPTAEEGLKVLVDPPNDDADKKWRGPYIKQQRDDPWGHPYQYRVPGSHHASSFDIWSRGGDGPEGEASEIGNW